MHISLNVYVFNGKCLRLCRWFNRLRSFDAEPKVVAVREGMGSFFGNRGLSGSVAAVIGRFAEPHWRYQ